MHHLNFKPSLSGLVIPSLPPFDVGTLRDLIDQCLPEVWPTPYALYIAPLHVWQSQVEIKDYSYRFLTTSL